MFKRFYPKKYVKSVFDIDYVYLQKIGINALVFDIDNTLVPFDVEHPTDEILSLIDKLLKMGFKVLLLSNNSEERVAAFNISLQLPNVSRANKPTLKGIRRALELLNSDIKNTAQIGDQIFTDVWCGNRLGLYTILVKPTSVRDEFSVRLKRGMEKLVVSAYVKTLTEKERENL